MKRNVIQLAKSTLVVSIPAKWAKRQKLQKGDSLNIDDNGNRLIISSKETNTEGRVEIDVTGRSPLIKRALGALYKVGYDEVKVTFNSAEELQHIQSVIREEFIGFEVTEQYKNSLVFKKLTKIESAEFSTMVRRMFLIIKSMSEDTLEALKKNDDEWLEKIVLRDKDVNKIADFCRRILNTSEGQCKRTPPSYYIIEQLEKIGDGYRDTANAAIGLGRPSPKILLMVKETNRLFDQFYTQYFKLDLDEMAAFVKKSKLLKSKFSKDLKTFPKKELELCAITYSLIENIFSMNGPLMAEKL